MALEKDFYGPESTESTPQPSKGLSSRAIALIAAGTLVVIGGAVGVSAVVKKGDELPTSAPTENSMPTPEEVPPSPAEPTESPEQIRYEKAEALREKAQKAICRATFQGLFEGKAEVKPFRVEDEYGAPTDETALLVTARVDNTTVARAVYTDRTVYNKGTAAKPVAPKPRESDCNDSEELFVFSSKEIADKYVFGFDDIPNSSVSYTNYDSIVVQNDLKNPTLAKIVGEYIDLDNEPFTQQDLKNFAYTTQFVQQQLAK